MTHLQPGQVLAEHSVGPVDPWPMKVVAALTQDPNPIHWDVDSVRGFGLGDRVINQGTMNISYVNEYAARVAGGHDNVLSLSATFRGNVRAGDVVACSGSVIQVEAEVATLDLLASVDGNPVVTATAAVRMRV